MVTGRQGRPVRHSGRASGHDEERERMSASENKALVQRLFEQGMNERKPEIFDECVAANFVNHDLPAPTPGPEGFLQSFRVFEAARQLGDALFCIWLEHADPPSAEANSVGRGSGDRLVKKHRLTFDKASTDGSGKCNIVSMNDRGDRVYGILFWTTFSYAPCGSVRNSQATSIWAKTRVWKTRGKVGCQRFMYWRLLRLPGDSGNLSGVGSTLSRSQPGISEADESSPRSTDR